jgi:hypothetical protein
MVEVGLASCAPAMPHAVHATKANIAVFFMFLDPFLSHAKASVQVAHIAGVICVRPNGWMRGNRAGVARSRVMRSCCGENS